MKFLHIVNESVTCEVTGDTGYAVSINYLVAELRQQGHTNKFYSIPWCRDDRVYGHIVLCDAEMGHVLYETCMEYDIVIIHATTAVPETFVQLCQTGMPFRLITIVHDPVFCNATYGYNVESNCVVPISRWNEKYLFDDPQHITEIMQTYAPSTIRMIDVQRMYRVCIDLFNCGMTICPSPQVVSLLASFGVMPAHMRFIPHAIPDLTKLHGARSDQQVVSVLTWNKADYRTTLDVATSLSGKHFHLICSDFMRNKLCKYGLPSNVTLAAVMSRDNFFQYIDQHQIGLCLHLSRAFETFALLPYEMAQLGVRTTMSDNDSGLTEAIRCNNLQDCSVDLDYTTDEVIAALNQPLSSWDRDRIVPPLRIAAYAKQLVG